MLNLPDLWDDHEIYNDWDLSMVYKYWRSGSYGFDSVVQTATLSSIFQLLALGILDFLLVLSPVFLYTFCLKMQFHSFVVVAATLLRTASAQDQYTATSPSSVDAARATALTLSPTSHVRGKTFDRFVNIWLENTDYDMAFGDRKTSFQFLHNEYST